MVNRTGIRGMEILLPGNQFCLAYSYDNGYTWEDKGPIVTSNTPKPETRRWGGAGDCSVVWDSVNNRWNCYHQEHNIRLAVSYDPLGAPGGTWKKLYNGEFNEDGLGGMSSPISNLFGYWRSESFCTLEYILQEMGHDVPWLGWWYSILH